jgi:hypothetical protein
VITERAINWTIQRHCGLFQTYKVNVSIPSQAPVVHPRYLVRVHVDHPFSFFFVLFLCVLCLSSSCVICAQCWQCVCPWQAMGGLTYMSTTNWSATFIQHILHSQRVVSLIRYALPAATSFGGIVPINGETRLQNWNGSYIVVTVLLEIGCHILHLGINSHALGLNSGIAQRCLFVFVFSLEFKYVDKKISVKLFNLVI